MDNNVLSPQKITLFAMTEKGYIFIKKIITRYKPMLARVVIGEDLSIENDFSEEITELCKKNNIPFIYRKSHKKIDTEYAMAISWRWMINHPQNKLIVFHDSLLPKYRGFAPLVNALINGETKIGVTALFGAQEYDRGEILHQSAIEIEYPITISEAITSVSQCYIKSGIFVLDLLRSEETLKPHIQDETVASYSLWRDEQDYRINWSDSACKIRRFIDAVGQPYKGACCLIDGNPARILSAQEIDDVFIENRTPGKVIFIRDEHPIVVCGTGLLKITNFIDEKGHSLLPLSKFRSRFE